MRINRTMALVGGGLLATWLASAASYRFGPPVTPAIPATPVAASPSQIEAEAARLRELLTPRTALAPAGRNPFRFVPRVEAIVPRTTPATDADTVIRVPPAPPVKLVGVAESSSPGSAGPRRTAILTLEGRLFLAAEGEALEARYRVERVDAEAAELTDLMTESRITVALER
jgi:hypothetical protein